MDVADLDHLRPGRRCGVPDHGAPPPPAPPTPPPANPPPPNPPPPRPLSPRRPNPLVALALELLDVLALAPSDGSVSVSTSCAPADRPETIRSRLSPRRPTMTFLVVCVPST